MTPTEQKYLSRIRHLKCKICKLEDTCSNVVIDLNGEKIFDIPPGTYLPLELKDQNGNIVEIDSITGTVINITCGEGGDCEEVCVTLTIEDEEVYNECFPSTCAIEIPIDAFVSACEPATYRVFDGETLLDTGSINCGENEDIDISIYFPACETLCQQIADSNWTTIKACMSTGQIEDATTDLCVPCDTLCDLIAPEPWSAIKACMSPTQITDAEDDLCSPCPAPKGRMPLKTWQVTSQGSGTDGDLEQGYGVSLLVLPYNNPFGTTERFTAPDGSQTYTDAIACDWLSWNEYTNTVLMIHFGSATGQVMHTNRNLTDGLSYIAGLTVGGYSGWRMINKSEIEFLGDNETSLNDLNFPPFNIGAVNIQTSTAYSSTNRAIRGTSGAVGVSTTSSTRTLAVRNGTVVGTIIS